MHAGRTGLAQMEAAGDFDDSEDEDADFDAGGAEDEDDDDFSGASDSDEVRLFWPSSCRMPE